MKVRPETQGILLKGTRFPRVTKILGLLFLGFLISASVQVDELRAEQEEFVDTYSKQFEFFNNCEQIGLIVQKQEKSSEVDLTEKAITNSVESRLRSARIFADGASDSFLAVNVQIVGDAYNVSVGLGKSLEDHRFSKHLSPLPLVGPAYTWHMASTGTHAGQGGFILSQLSQIVEEFLVEYFKVNQKYCSKKR